MSPVYLMASTPAGFQYEPTQRTRSGRKREAAGAELTSKLTSELTSAAPDAPPMPPTSAEMLEQVLCCAVLCCAVLCCAVSNVM